MLTSSQLRIILWNEKITVGLLDPDARTLVERLVIQADNLSELAHGQPLADLLEGLVVRGRLIARIVALWVEGKHAGASQLAASGGLARFLPAPPTSSNDLIIAFLPE